MSHILIRDVEHLKRLCNDNGEEEPIECFINLGGIRSSKNITYNPELETFTVINEIDWSEQELTERELMDSSCKHTNIGRAIIENRFYLYNW